MDRKTTGGTGGARGKKEENGNVVAAEENGNAKAEEPSIEEQVCRDGDRWSFHCQTKFSKGRTIMVYQNGLL